MIKKIVLPLAIMLSMGAVTQVVHAEDTRIARTGGAVTATTQKAATISGVATTWTFSDGQTKYGYAFPASSEGYALAIAPDGEVSTLSTRSARSSTVWLPDGSVQIDGAPLSSVLTLTWQKGTLKGHVASGYVFTLGATTYLWTDLDNLSALTTSEAASFAATSVH